MSLPWLGVMLQPVVEGGKRWWNWFGVRSCVIHGNAAMSAFGGSVGE